MRVFDFDIECVVLDIDDTLYLERDYVHSGFAAVDVWLTQELGIRGFRELASGHFERGTRGDTFDRVLSELDVATGEELIPRMVDVYRTHTPRIRMTPDAATFVASLAGKARMAVITDGPLSSQAAKATALGLPQLTPNIIYTSSLGAGLGKPHPAAFEKVELLTGCRAAQCIYVADNPNKDFVAPSARGWRTLRVRRVGSLHEHVESGADVEATVETLETRPC
jgi:putative hydrolase of the HAD superfamily